MEAMYTEACRYTNAVFTHGLAAMCLSPSCISLATGLLHWILGVHTPGDSGNKCSTAERLSERSCFEPEDNQSGFLCSSSWQGTHAGVCSVFDLLSRRHGAIRSSSSSLGHSAKCEKTCTKISCRSGCCARLLAADFCHCR